MATESFDRLRKLLDELFQFDRADLDFGIYRIMNQTRTEVRNFLSEDLLPQVREALGTYRNTERERAGGARGAAADGADTGDGRGCDQ
ncbi:MAG: hypothetical protein M3P51_15995 [Chloroflexota bacterium]|nr:hypothetical protein [Chloroflexota bacterium]